MHKVKVHIKSQSYRPRVGGLYRAGSVQILDVEEAEALSKAGICTIVDDPYIVPGEPPIPYLEEEPSAEELAKKAAAEKDAKIDAEIQAMLDAEAGRDVTELEGHGNDNDEE